MMYLVSRSISQGWRAGMMSLSGTAVGFVVYIVMANLGLAAVFLVVPWLFIALKIAGAIYLLWLAYKTLRPGGKSLFETSGASELEGCHGQRRREHRVGDGHYRDAASGVDHSHQGGQFADALGS
jgi:threonine/homoserine/homoserine lactone efflux protein